MVLGDWQTSPATVPRFLSALRGGSTRSLLSDGRCSLGHHSGGESGFVAQQAACRNKRSVRRAWICYCVFQLASDHDARLGSWSHLLSRSPMVSGHRSTEPGHVCTDQAASRVAGATHRRCWSVDGSRPVSLCCSQARDATCIRALEGAHRPDLKHQSWHLEIGRKSSTAHAKPPVHIMGASSYPSCLSLGCCVRSPTPIFDPLRIAPTYPAIRRFASASLYIPFSTPLQPCF